MSSVARGRSTRDWSRPNSSELPELGACMRLLTDDYYEHENRDRHRNGGGGTRWLLSD